MSTDLSTDPRFTRLPQKFIDQIKAAPPTGPTPPGGDSWHEVQFQMNGMLCQCAVVNGEYVALSQWETDQIISIIKIWTAEELGQ